jgi:molybdenum cofactor cytidylyltransferase
VPAIFPRSLFPALLELHGDQGARALLQQPGAARHAIDFPGGDFDLDSPEDVARLREDSSTPPSAETN